MNKSATRNNFIINFYNNVELIISGHAEYLILLSNLPQEFKQNPESVTSDVFDKEVNEDLMNQIVNANNNLKFLVHKTILQLKSLGDDKTIKEAVKYYNKLKTQQYLKEEDLEQYSLSLNNFMMNHLGDVDFNDVAQQLYN